MFILQGQKDQRADSEKQFDLTKENDQILNISHHHFEHRSSNKLYMALRSHLNQPIQHFLFSQKIPWNEKITLIFILIFTGLAMAYCYTWYFQGSLVSFKV